MKKNKKKIILSGVLLVTVGITGIVLLQNKETEKLDRNVEKELSAYNYDANNILDNIFEENGTTILPIVYKTSPKDEKDKIARSKVEKDFKNAGLTIKSISTKDIVTGTKIITTTNKTYTVVVYGDVDGDGYVDTFDAQAVLRHIVFGGKNELTGTYKMAANIDNDDGTIDVFDVERILKFYVGNEEELVLYPPVSNKEKDKEPPVIELIGNNPQVVEVHNRYVEAGAKVTDNCDTNLTATIDASKVNVDVVGEYEVTYNAKDARGNVAKQVIRKVQVVDTTAPVITVSEDNVYTMEVNTTKPTFKATVKDNYDKNVKVVITDDINTSVVGKYTVTFTAIDANNNIATQTKEFQVVDTTKPKITLNGDNPQIIELGSKYTELGATVTDNYDKNLVATIDASKVNVDAVGQYKVTYNAKDANGNIADEVTRTVIVRKSVYVTGIEIVKNPDNCNYKYGNTIDTTGLQVYAKMSNGDTKDVTSSVVCDINKATANKVTVKYTTTDTSDTSSKEFTATFDINVVNYIVGIKIVNNPDTVEYVENENISLEGIKVVAIKADGNEDEEITVTTKQGQAVFGTNVVTVEYTTTNTIDDKTRTFTDTFDINVVYPISNITALPINKTGYRYSEVDIATISSGKNQKEITVDDTIECEILKDGIEVGGTEAEVSFSANNNPNITGQILITMMAKSVGKYTITPKVNGIDASPSLTVEIKESPIVTSIEFDDNLEVTAGDVLAKPITFKHKYPDNTEVDIDVKANRIQLTIDGVDYEFIDIDGNVVTNNTKEVSKINLIPSDVEKQTIKKLKIEVINENAENCVIERNITILPEPKLQIAEDTIKLYADKAKIDTDKVVIDGDENDYTIYTLVPISLDDGTKLTKKEVDDYITVEEAKDNAIVLYYKNDKTTEATNDNDIVEYMGISAFDIYDISNNEITISYKGKLVKTMNVEPVKKQMSEVNVKEINKTGVRYEELDVATISSGNNEDEIVTDNPQCILDYEVTKDKVPTNDLEVTYSPNNSSTIDGQVLVTVRANKAGVYKLLPKVNGITPTSPIEITIKENPIVTDVKIGEYTTADTIKLPIGEQTKLPLTFIHEYSESEKAEIDVTYNRLPNKGTNYEFLYKNADGSISEVTSGDVNMIAITPSQTDTSITISVNNDGKIKEFKFTIEPVALTKSIETDSTIKFADVEQDGVSIEDDDGVVFTLVPIALKDNLGNETPLKKADFEGTDSIITITYNGDKTDEFCAIANKYYYNDKGTIKEAQSNDAPVEYIGFSKDWTEIEELAKYPIVITYNGVATNITITK